MRQTTYITLNLQTPNYATVYAARDNLLSRYVSAALLDGSAPWTPPAGTYAEISYIKPDGTGGYYDTVEDGSLAYTITNNVVEFVLAQQALTVPGDVRMALDFFNADGDSLSTFTFVLTVPENSFPYAQLASGNYFNVMQATLAEMAQYIKTLQNGYGAPLVASTAADMTDKTRVYVYTGSESGYTNGNWYYWDGSAWVSGGVYNAVAITTDRLLKTAGEAADAQAVGDAVSGLNASVYSEERLPTSVSGLYMLTPNSGISNPATAANTTSASYCRSAFLTAENLLATLGLSDYEWCAWAYRSNTWGSQSHTLTNGIYYNGMEDIYIIPEDGDVRFLLSFRRVDRAALTTDTSDPSSDLYKISHALKLYRSGSSISIDSTLSISGDAADAAAVGAAIYRTKSRAANLPAALTWWEMPSDYTGSNPAGPANMPSNSYTANFGSVLAGFNGPDFSLTADNLYFVYCFSSLHNTVNRNYVILGAGNTELYIGRTSNSGLSVTWGTKRMANLPRSRIMFFGDSITRGCTYESGTLAWSNPRIPDYVARELNCECQNFGIGNIGWCAGWYNTTSQGRNKTNAIGYLKRVGDPTYYNAADVAGGYKFVGSGDWEDFNTIVIALGTNDVAYPLGSLSDIDDTLTYQEVMAWQTSAQDTDPTNRTIVKAMYQVYRYIRESEDQHAEGEPYVPGGKHLNIIISDPIIGGAAGTTPPMWGYTYQRAGGYTKLQMCELYKAFAERYGLGHISNFDAPIDRVKLTNSLPDNTHPNNATYKALGLHYAAKIAALVL